MKIMILADDMTGAVDTSVQLSQRGLATCVINAQQPPPPRQHDAVAVNLETRHLPAEQIKRTVTTTVHEALQAGTEWLYLKTDSGLRGNIGCTLSAAVAASGKGLLFVPSYPAMNRRMRSGVYYVDGVPVSNSFVGRDLYNAVQQDHIVSLLRSQGLENVYCRSVHEDLMPEPGKVIVADAGTEEDMAAVAEQVRQWKTPSLLAGCAGFAQYLPDIVGRHAEASPDPPPVFSRVIVISGSVTDHTFRQIRHAANHGAVCHSLHAHSPTDATARKLAQRLLASPTDFHILAVSCERDEYEQNMLRERQNGDSVSKRGTQIAQTLGETAAHIVSSGWKGVLMIIGGDTLSSAIRMMRCTELWPCQELFPGVVLSCGVCGQQQQWLVTKAGSFGSDSVISDVTAMLLRRA